MTAIDPTTTLGALVSEHPELASRFDALGLDYCCGGAQTLVAAIADADLDKDATLDQLAATPPSETTREWEGIDGLVDHLEATHHVYLREALPRLTALADKVAGLHRDRHPELEEVAVLVRELQSDLDPHLMKEERVLFPMIRELAAATEAPSFHCGSLNNPISVMLVEHDTVGELLGSLRRISSTYEVPDDGCASYRALYEGLAELEADTHLHVHKENNLLFPAVTEAEEALIATSR